MTSLEPDMCEQRNTFGLLTEPALPEGASFLARLVKETEFLETEIVPLATEARSAGEWYVANRYDDFDGSYSIQVFVWPPGSKTKIHDHSSWGAFCCTEGTVLEERYQRLDDGSLLDFARLKKIWQLAWSSEDGVSTVLPYEGGIHRIGNPGRATAISVHLYGPRMGTVDGRDYDPSRDYVCDRQDD